ncbi:polyhydroxyalkanoate depolymerase [Baekduia soli]|uniref:polyhydroxyalkanoate depolymerase n=1 Tax=Baekduia soli TaxID=496014 RepID=UPI002AA2A6AE|nr:polyhydroxyalkanoate depolymerase [Baekduia soli]
MRPDFRVDEVQTPAGRVGVQEETVVSTPFGSLRHFVKERGAEGQPRVLILPGLAGHFATLVRGTVRTMLADHDVYVADWHNARDVPRDAGRFGLDEFILHIVDFLDAIGPGTHLVAVCQPCVAAIAAAALMSEDGHEARPASLTLMSGPVDARINPGPINAFSEKQSLAKLEKRAITTVPWPHRGAGRRVYPGFLQVVGFMSMAPRRHAEAFAGLFADSVRGRREQAARTEEFYDEYFAVLDIAAEFYLETARAVFMEHDLARGVLTVGGRTVDPSQITCPLLTVEAEKDEMCPPGQTEAAHALCTGVAAADHHHHLQEGVGHYGVFSGSRFDREIYPVMRAVIAAAQPVEA